MKNKEEDSKDSLNSSHSSDSTKLHDEDRFTLKLFHVKSDCVDNHKKNKSVSKLKINKDLLKLYPCNNKNKNKESCLIKLKKC